MRDDRRHDVLIDESRSHSQYGLRGVRVGEASHPGPPRRQSSRPIAGRDVISRIDVVGVSHSSLQEVPPIQEGQEKGLEQQRCPVDQEEQVCGSHRE